MNTYTPPPIHYEIASSKDFELSSPSFSQGNPIDSRYSCEGANETPVLRWSGAPADTKSFALLVEDPDAPTPTPWVHWLVANIPGSTKELMPLGREGEQEGGMVQGENSFKQIGFDGPCPPAGKPHRYYFILYALRDNLTLGSGFSKELFLKSLEGKILGRATLMGTYQKKR